MMKAFGKLIVTAALGALLINSEQVLAQEQPSLRDRAYQFYLAGDYAKSAQIYNRIEEKKELSVKEVYAVADSYYQINEYTLAKQWLKRATDLDSKNKDAFWKYAQILKINGQYAESKKQFVDYKQRFPDGKNIQIEIDGCDSALLWTAKPTTHVLKNEKEVNTSFSEFGVLPLSNGVLYSGEPSVATVDKSDMTGNAYLRIFSAGRDEDGITLKYPVLSDGVYNDAKYYVGPVTTNQDQDVLFVTRTYAGSSAEKVKRDGMRFKKHNLELILYKKNGESWIPEAFPYNNVEKYSVGHASLSSDGKVLYFASDMPGGKGGVDIWYSQANADGTWGTPANAGNEINSPGDEMFPSTFGDTLYFSSNGYAGMGGLDVFKAVGSKSSFRGRENLKSPVNSSTDDFAYVVSADDEERQYGYFSSNRIGGAGGDDIYSFVYTKPKITIRLQGKVFDKESTDPLGQTQVRIFDDKGKLLSTFFASSPTFDTELQSKLAQKIVVSKDGFMSDSLFVPAIRATKDTTLFASFKLQPVNKEGIVFVLDNIYYDFNKSDIRPDAAKVLDQLVNTMTENPTLQIELSSHTDSRGSDSYNMKLSDRRAKSAVEYIISKGIAKERLVSKGYGESKLVNECANGVKCTEEQHQANRRTEVKVLKY
ncbi:OmpA family protein [Sphingobacterium spiritivorum ATCC 33300]|uniref:OmpA family protein n=1 Tax=Sphingobacterium spiritivorum ATCC 33300 TaxID=525372 RepID=C2FYQ3_SPHSI|nr:OmpA family protein [Sphingobacterium spiritivorum]EEI91939.1 OmpA family protein [Sphingobacterium spiritivorum ATCC 33300]QQS96464.1 OmpA family protein [Sphingobacterium spiritivorum]